MKHIVIKKGFYKHWKHDPNGPKGNCCYEVLNASHSKVRQALGTEKDEIVIVYRPLYPSFVYEAGKHWDHKKLEEFLKPVLPAFEGGTTERYALVIDPEEIKILTAIRDVMYADEPKEIILAIPE